MKWLEIIELRTVDSNRESLESQLQELIDEADMEKEQQTIKAYSHAMVDSDFSIHLFHKTEIVEKAGSRLGLRLASALREFGLVNHNIWIEMQSK
jgi:hypothetical protein